MIRIVLALALMVLGSLVRPDPEVTNKELAA